MTTRPRTCSSCGRPRPVELQISVKAGPVITMMSCSACENRSWLIDGEPASRDAVLAAAAGDADFVLAPSRRSVREAAAAPPAARRT